MSIYAIKNDHQIQSTDPILGFEDERLDGTGWFRFLTFEGKRAYMIGTCCETCEFLFERVGIYNQGLLPKELSALFKSGLNDISAEVLKTVAPLFPAGNYEVVLQEITPRKVKPQSLDDYFTNEQLTAWPIDFFWGLPHYPKVEYYRSRTQSISADEMFFEFINPTMPPASLNEETVQMYQSSITSGDKPTVFAISIIDTKSSESASESNLVKTHSCLSHYVLDGHHKLEAAARLGAPITMLSFVAKDRCLSHDENVAICLNLLKK